MPQGANLLDWLTALSTVALTVFAAVQLYQIRVEHRNRARAAFGGAWVEFWRIWTTSANWQRDDLVSQAEQGLLRHDAILPLDWGAMAPLVAQLGMQPARLAGMAYAHAQNAASQAIALQLHAEEWEELYPQFLGMGQRPEDLDQYQPYITTARQLESAVRQYARRAADDFEDALASAPAWLRIEKWNGEGLKGETARRLEDQFGRVARERRSVLWRLRLWAATVLQRAAAAVLPSTSLRLPSESRAKREEPEKARLEGVQ